MGAKPNELMPSGGRWPLFVGGCSFAGFVAAGMLFRCIDEFGALPGLVLALSLGLLLGWLHALQKRQVLFVDQSIPLCLIVGGVLGIVAAFVPKTLEMAVGLIALAASAATLIAYMRSDVPEEEEPAPPSFSRELIAKPLAYQFAYSAVYGLCFGLLYQVYGSLAVDSFSLVTLGVGTIAAGVLVYLMRLRMQAAMGLETITRVAMLALMASWLAMLARLGGSIPLALFSLGAALFFYLIERMAVDLKQAFGLSRWLVVLVPATCAVACGLGALLSWLFGISSIGWANPSAIAVFCIVAMVIVTVYGLSTERVWTAHDLREGRLSEREESKQGAWRAACEAVCEEHGLTRRESEVFELLAKGRNAAYVEETLVISSHTVKSHMLKIYRKLGVHSQQELIDMVENERGRT